MRLFYIFVIIGLCGNAKWMVEGSEPSNLLANNEGGINSLKNIVNLYSKLERIDWKKFEEIRDKLSENKQHYTVRSAELIGRVTTLIMDARDHYYSATQTVSEWCSTMIGVLPTYIRLFEAKNFNAAKVRLQNAFLVRMIDIGLVKLENAQGRLNASTFSFNEVVGKAEEFGGIMNGELEEKKGWVERESEKQRKNADCKDIYFLWIHIRTECQDLDKSKVFPEIQKALDDLRQFHENIATQLASAKTQIDKTKIQLQQEISAIGEVKTRADTLKIFLPDDDESIELIINDTKEKAIDLLNISKEYVETHKFF